MNSMRNCRSKVYLAVLAIVCVLYVPLINASEWWDSAEAQSGFSGFAPPVDFSEYSDDKGKKQWRSGSSFNESNKVRYLPVTSKNPWKPVNSLHYKKTFGSRRPWGNIPDRKPSKVNNMKFHDQRFKQWSHQLDSSYRNSMMMSDPLTNYAGSSMPFVGGYGLPGSIYNRPLITPGIYPGGLLSPVAYGAYPGALMPYSGLSARPWGW